MIQVNIFRREPLKLTQHITDMFVLSATGDNTRTEVENPLQAAQLNFVGGSVHSNTVAYQGNNQTLH